MLVYCVFEWTNLRGMSRFVLCECRSCNAGYKHGKVTQVVRDSAQYFRLCSHLDGSFDTEKKKSPNRTDTFPAHLATLLFITVHICAFVPKYITNQQKELQYLRCILFTVFSPTCFGRYSCHLQGDVLITRIRIL